MIGSIVVSGQEVGSNPDILNGSRLANAPSNGILTFEIQASDNNATDNYIASIQMPSGDTPLTDVRMPCGNTSGLAGVIDKFTSYAKQFAIQQGGKCIFSCVETGDAELTWRITFTPS